MFLFLVIIFFYLHTYSLQHFLHFLFCAHVRDETNIEVILVLQNLGQVLYLQNQNQGWLLDQGSI